MRNTTKNDEGEEIKNRTNNNKNKAIQPKWRPTIRQHPEK